MPIALGLDVGTSSSKVVALDLDTGHIVAEASKGYPLATPHAGWAEQDPALWVAAAEDVLARVAKALGARAAEVVGLGLSGQMHSAVVLDQRHAVVRPALLWCDTRTTAECRAIEAAVGKEGLARIVGNAALEGFTLPKVLWLRAHEPDAFARIRHVVMPKDYVAFSLTGVLGTEVSDASGTLAFSSRLGARADELLGAVDLDPELFSAVSAAHESSAPRGTLLAAIAEKTGLPAHVVVACGAADNAASAVGLGAVREGLGMVSLGTSGVVLLPTDEPRTDPTLRLHAFRGAAPGRSYVMGVMLSAGLSLRWFRDTLGAEEQAIARARGVDPYVVIEESAAKSRPGAGGVVFLPYLMGERTPHADAKARGAFVGMSALTTRGDLARAVMEGIVFGVADLLACTSSVDRPIALQTLRATGGGARSPLFLELLADVLGVTIETTENPEGGALGAAILGAVAAGAYTNVDEGVKACVRVAARIEPRADRRGAYEAPLAAYRALYPACRDVMHALATP